MVIPLFGISKVVISDLWISFLSSDATCVAIASFVLLYPSASATSLPTNHTTPSISTVLSSPNCGWLNTVGVSVGESASGSIRGVQFSDPLHAYKFSSMAKYSIHNSTTFCPWEKTSGICILKVCPFMTHPHSPWTVNGKYSTFLTQKLYEILLTLFEYTPQKSISVSSWTLSQLCQKNKSSGCVFNQTYYFACNITFI